MGKRYDDVEMLTENPFLNLYHIHARTKTGNPFSYYFASRNDQDTIKQKTHSRVPEGMAIYAVTMEEEPRLVMVRQYRYPLDAYVYELPAGLIEKEETPEAAAVREMREETGMELIPYLDGKSYYRNAFYLAQGMTDESGSIVYGYAKGEISLLEQEDSEDITVLLLDKEQVREILAKENVSIRAAFLCMQFLQSTKEEPFYFLEV